MKHPEFWKPVIASLVATPVCLLIGIASGGAGHGDYVLARILFPYTMLASFLFEEIVAPLVVLAVAQFPLYGVALGVAAKRGRFGVTLLLLLAVHALAAAACFTELGERFSG